MPLMPRASSDHTPSARGAAVPSWSAPLLILLPWRSVHVSEALAHQRHRGITGGPALITKARFEHVEGLFGRDAASLVQAAAFFTQQRKEIPTQLGHCHAAFGKGRLAQAAKL